MRSGPRQLEAQSVNLVNNRTRLLCCAVCMYVHMYVQVPYSKGKARQGTVQAIYQGQRGHSCTAPRAQMAQSWISGTGNKRRRQ
jgi:hypothetical protein